MIIFLDILQYDQVKNAIAALQKKRLIRGQLTKFESLLESGALFSRPLSKVCNVLIDSRKMSETYWFQWEKDLDMYGLAEPNGLDQINLLWISQQTLPFERPSIK